MITYDTPTSADAAELDAMALASWRDTFAHFYQPDDLATFLAQSFGPTGWLRSDLANPAVRWQVARADGAIVGFVKLVPPTLEQATPTDVQVGQLYVATDWHGKGIAQSLMDWAIATAHAADARAIRFYQRYGFVHVGDYAFPVGKQIDRDLVMRLAL